MEKNVLKQSVVTLFNRRG